MRDSLIVKLQNELQQFQITSILQSMNLTANELEYVLNDDFSLLLGVIADQSVRSEIAWSLPYKLYKRAGKVPITPQWILENKDQVDEILSQKPALHRYPHKMAEYFISLSKMILVNNGGDVDNLLHASLKFDALINKLTSIKGISRKKAGLLCLILELDKHIPITEKQNSYALMDGHVSRFLSDGASSNVSETEATELFKRINPSNPALVSTVVWRLDRK